MWNQPYRKNDVEAGARPLYPMMLENPELRWSFIRKVYSIITLQLLATIAVASVVVSVRPISLFFVSTAGGLALYIVLIITPFIGKCIFLFDFSLLFVLRGCSAYFWLSSLCKCRSAVPFILLPPEAPRELSSSGNFHDFSCVRCGIDLCVY